MMADDVEEVEEVEEVVIKDVFDDSTDKGAEEVEAKAETTEEAKETKTEEVEETKVEESPSSDKEAGLQATIIAERRRRQEAVKELNELKAEKVAKVEAPDPVTDPEGYSKYLMDRQDQLAIKTKIEMSQELMRQHNDDYDETEKLFMSLLGGEDDDGVFTVKDEKLFSDFRSSPSPAGFAYSHAKKHQDFQLKSSDDYETNLRKEIEEKVRKEYADKGITGLPDLTNAAASASNTDKAVEISENYIWDDS